MALDADELELLVDGRAFAGWEGVQVSRSMEAASGAFQCTCSTREPPPIRAGQEVTVRAAGEVLITGHVDAVEVEGDERARTMTVSGRDRTADLVDCSELSDPGEWHDVDLQQLLELIARPFGVEVRSLLEEPTEVFLRFARQSGETAWSAVERACRLRGVLVHSGGDGSLLLERPARTLASASLVEGRNVRSYKVSEDLRQRFSSYVVRAQLPGGDDFYADQSALVEGTASDANVERFRPLLVLAEGALAFENAQDRAQWEATVRAARSKRVTAVVAGWRQTPGGRLWQLNELTHVLLPGAPLDQVLLVNELGFSKDGEGTTTTLGLTRKDAYDPQPDVEDQDELDFLEDDEGGGF